MSDSNTPDDRQQTTWRCERCDIDVQIVAPVGLVVQPVPCPGCWHGLARTSGEEMGNG